MITAVLHAQRPLTIVPPPSPFSSTYHCRQMALRSPHRVNYFSLEMTHTCKAKRAGLEIRRCYTPEKASEKNVLPTPYFRATISRDTRREVS